MTALTLDTLADVPRWVAWCNERRDGKVTKVPYTARGRKAAADNPGTWHVRARAEAVARQVVNGLGGGVGIELGDIGDGRYLAGLDLDTCRAQDGSIADWAAAVLARFCSYAEISPSGDGVKAFFTIAAADMPALRVAMETEHGRQWKRGGGEHPPAIELYVSNRYFAVTGHRVSEAPNEVTLVPLDALLWLVVEAGPAFSAADTSARDGGGNRSSDRSRSAAAFRKGAALRRAGMTYAQMVEALRADPATAAWTLEKGEANGQRQLRRIWEKATAEQEEGDSRPPGFSDEALALRFTERHKDGLRYVAAWGRWLVRQPAVWEFDDTLHAFDRARMICREAAAYCKDARIAPGLASAKTVAAVERLAKADRRHAAKADQWDTDPWLLNTPGGVLDLRTGRTRAHQPDDYLTKITTVAPGGACPTWHRFLGEITHGDLDLITFLQCFIGYTLTGITREHAFVFLHGPGGNGKSVLLSTIAAMLGDYATTAMDDVFTVGRSDHHKAHEAALRGARMVLVPETEANRPWAESKLKTLVAGDKVSARVMRGDPFEFMAQFKLWIAGNHRPTLRNPDPAMRRRLNLVPLTFVPRVPDLRLPERLLVELPGILLWAVEGCLAWQRNGLRPPAAVLDATAEYFREQDSVAAWLAERCDGVARAEVGSAVAFADWSTWAKARGEDPGTAKWFSGALEHHALKKVTKRGAFFLGLKLRPSDGGVW